MKIYGYVRVSARDQNIDRQLAALEEFQIPKKQIYCDYQSGKDFDRPRYKALIKVLKKGDVVIIKHIDRLGRNYEEILEQWRIITKEIGADIKVLDMNLLDTTDRPGNLTGTFVADLVLQILAYVAQTEREAIKQRQAEGISAARRRGVKFGRPSCEIPENFDRICRECRENRMTIRQAAAILQMSSSTFYRKYCSLYKEM